MLTNLSMKARIVFFVGVFRIKEGTCRSIPFVTLALIAGENGEESSEGNWFVVFGAHTRGAHFTGPTYGTAYSIWTITASGRTLRSLLLVSCCLV